MPTASWKWKTAAFSKPDTAMSTAIPKPRPTVFETAREVTLWLALCGILIVALKVTDSVKRTPAPPPPSRPAVKTFPKGIAAAGMVEAIRENTQIGVPVSALVTGMEVKVWDKVEAGAALFHLDDRELRAQLETQLAEVSVREAELAKALNLHLRTESLRGQNAVSMEVADGRRDDHRIAAARLDSAQAAVRQSRQLLERLVVRAPVAGTVLQVNAREGEYVSSGAATPPVLLGAIDEVQVRADVDEQVAPRVTPGSKAAGYLKGDTRKAIPMEFVRIEPYVVPKRNLTGASTERVDTRVLQIIYKFARPEDRRVYVGQQMDVFIEEKEGG